MADHTEDSEPGRFLAPADGENGSVRRPAKTRPGVKTKGRWLDHFKDLGVALTVAVAIATASVTLVTWAFRGSVLAVQAAQEKLEIEASGMNDDLNLMNQTQIRTTTALEHLHEEIRATRLDYRLLEQGRRLPALAPEPEPRATPVAGPTP